MASSIDTLKELVLNVVNGNASPGTLLVDAAQKAAQTVLAEAKYIKETTPIVAPQLAELTEEIAKLEVNKTAVEAQIKLKEAAVAVSDVELDVQEKVFEEKKKIAAQQKDKKDKEAAKAKAQGETIKEPPTKSNDVAEEKTKFTELKKKSEKGHNEIKELQKEVKKIETQIKEKKDQFDALTAQLSPAAALVETKQKTDQAQQKVDSATTPESKAEAQKELEDAQQKENTIQQISDDHDKAIENNQIQNEPKLMQLRAEYQVMESGLTAINYLVTNIQTLITAATVSVGANGGGPLPALPSVTLPLGNILYGYAWAILANVKAASVRFLAIAQEIEYTPTTEMTIISNIKVTETTLAGLLSIAPAGSSLI